MNDDTDLGHLATRAAEGGVPEAPTNGRGPGQATRVDSGEPAATLAATLDAPSVPASGPTATAVDLGETVAAGAGELDAAHQPTQAFLDTSDDPNSPRWAKTTVAAPGGDGLSRLSPLGGGGESTEKYSRTKLHAKGGIGQVWLAHDATLGREVALKELRPDRHHSETTCSRFFEEARITGQLEHPGIVPIYEMARDAEGRQPFYTMRFVRGRTLAESIRDYHEGRRKGQAGPLDLAKLLGVFVDVCNAIGYAHSRGVIHRDLKGQNVVLGEFGEAMVLDWGLAKLVDAPEAAPAAGGEAGRDSVSSGEDHEATRDGQVLGTPAYMAPEQAQGRIDRIGPRTDIYALGAILYEILTGQPPFVAPTATEVVRLVAHNVPARPRAVNPRAPRALEAVCLRAMAREPEGRYGRAGELAEEVRRWLADEPVAAYPEPWPRRLGRWAKRHRQAVAAAAAVLVLGVGTLAVTSVLVRRERDEARRQREFARGAVNDMYTEVADQWLEDDLDPKQQEFLQKALAYYQGFAGRDGGTAAVRSEAALALTRVGDIRRKLGANKEAEAAYRDALARIDGLLGASPGDPELDLRRARARTHLAALLVGTGRAGEADPLLDRARQDLERQHRARPDDRRVGFELAQTCREQANRERLAGRSQAARDAYSRAVALLEPLAEGRPDAGSGPGATDAARDLGATLARLGVLQGELGETEAAEATLRRGRAVLEPLLAQFPTNPRIRAGLADSVDSLGRLVGRRAEGGEEAEGLLNVAVGHYQRLADDFPGRPEYQRFLARGLINLGSLRYRTGRPAQAEPSFRKAIEVLAALQARVPDEVKVRRDLGIAANDLGSVLEQTGHPELAIPEMRRAVEVQQELADRHPAAPEYRSLLADGLCNLATVLTQVERHEEADEALTRAEDVARDLVVKHRDRPDFRADLARVLAMRGAVLAAAGRAEEIRAGAEPAYREAIGLYDGLLAGAPDDGPLLAAAADCVNNAAELKLGDRRLPDARDLYDRALVLYRALARATPDDPAVRLNQGTVMLNLGEFLAEAGHPAEAEPLYVRASELFEPLASGRDANAQARFRLAYLLTNHARLLLAADRPAEARTKLEAALEHQRAYLKASRIKEASSPELRQQTGLLAQAILAEGRHREAAEVAVRIPKQAPDQPEARVEAAQLLALCVEAAETDGRLPEEQRSPLARLYADRAVAQLRVAIDAGYRPASPLAEDPAFRPLRPREDFRDLAAAPDPDPASLHE